MVHHFWAGLHCVSISIKELSTYQFMYEIFFRHCMAFQFHPSRLCPSSSPPLIRWMSVWRCVDSSSPTPTVWPAPPPPPAVPWSGGPSKLGGDLLWPRHFPSTRWKCFRYWSYMMICCLFLISWVQRILPYFVCGIPWCLWVYRKQPRI